VDTATKILDPLQDGFGYDKYSEVTAQLAARTAARFSAPPNYPLLVPDAILCYGFSLECGRPRLSVLQT